MVYFTAALSLLLMLSLLPTMIILVFSGDPFRNWEECEKYITQTRPFSLGAAIVLTIILVGISQLKIQIIDLNIPRKEMATLFLNVMLLIFLLLGTILIAKIIIRWIKDMIYKIRGG